jgi:uncharacterized repeat protein (TIGR03803 family)
LLALIFKANLPGEATVRKLNWCKPVCAVCVLSAVAAIAAPVPAQTFNTLHVWGGTDGANPEDAMIQGTDGNFYGTTEAGGANNECTYGCGTVFKISPAGTPTTLYSFCSQTGCTDGEAPRAALLQAANGAFYGTTRSGGAYGAGTVFKITPAGALTTLYSFCSQIGCPDGANPLGGLVQGSDGNFYGTTELGGTGTAGGCFGRECGTVFKITPRGTLTTLHNFDLTDGGNPFAGLVQATSGAFYGTTYLGGTNGGGTVYEITAAGKLTSLYSFCAETNCADGSGPETALVQAANGDFYGTTYDGGANAGTFGGGAGTRNAWDSAFPRSLPKLLCSTRTTPGQNRSM